MPPDEITISARFPDLAGKVALLTGASKGIGRATARFLGLQGVKLALSSRSADVGEAVCNDLRGDGAECLWITADVATAEGTKRVFDAALERFGRIDLLVNNAAVRGSRSLLAGDEADYRVAFEDNVRIVYAMSQLISRHMVDRGGGGAIVHISSVGGLRAHLGTAAYDASKGAVDALTRAMAVELAPHGIRVNAVAPGWTPSPEDVARRSDKVAAKSVHIPLGRPGRGEDIAAAIAFLASDAAAYITGQIIYVDGGLTAQLTPPGISV